MAIESKSVAARGASNNDSVRQESESPNQPGGGVPDATNGKTCHQCRQRIKDIASECKSQKNNKPCAVRICRKCLLNRYGERAEEVSTLVDWSCPKCRGICNCSVCMKKKGYQPTGQLSHTAKATGFSSVSDMINKGAVNLTDEKIVPGLDALPKKEKVLSLKKRRKENSGHGKIDDQPGESNAEVSLPLGEELTTVDGVNVSAQDVGNALQFLMFCKVFGKVLGVKEGEPQYVLHDMLNGREHRGKFSSTIQFHIILITTILNDRGEKSTTLSASYGKNSWFDGLKKCLSESRSSFTAEELDFLDKAVDYDKLDATRKLRVLNLLCDEVLGTVKLRNWIEEQNSELADKLKEAKQKVNNFKQKRKEDIVKAGLAEDGTSQSVSDPKAVVSATTLGEEKIDAEFLEAEELLSKKNCAADATRIEPIFIGRDGDAYWKLNCAEKSNILRQHVGSRETPTLQDKWYAIVDDAGKQTVESLVGGSLRGKRQTTNKRRKVLE